MFKKSLTLILLTVLVLTSFVIPAYADSAIGSEEIEDITQPTDTTMQLKESYTQEELNAILAHAYDINVPDGGLDFNNENFPLEQNGDVSLMATTSTSTDYYIALTSDGKLVSSPNSNTVTKSSYSSSSSTNAMLQWTFEEISDNVYVIRKKNSPTTCIAAVPSSSSIITKTYAAGDTNCHWSIRVMSMGSVICSASSNSAANGKYFYYSGGKFVLSSSSYTEFGLIDVDWWVPATTINVPNHIVALDGTALITGITSSPSTANLLTDKWLNVTFANSSICSINGNWSLEGEGIGNTTATMTHKITGISATFTVYVGHGARIMFYYDNAAVTFCNSASYINGTITNKIDQWFEAIRFKYAQELNIALIMGGKILYRSYPEQLDENENPICDSAGNPSSLCQCSEICEDSSKDSLKLLHHKNKDNILYRMPRPDTRYCLNVLITGHWLCEKGSGGKLCEKASTGAANRDCGIAIVSTNDRHLVKDENYEYTIQCAIAHEIGHLFASGLDHYGGKKPNTNTGIGQNSACIYGEDSDESDVYVDMDLCFYCKTQIQNNASRYNHH